MAHEIQCVVKIISSNEDKIIGWKGNVLEIGLIDSSSSGLLDFLKLNLSLSANACIIRPFKKNIFYITFKTKYQEDLRILFA